MTLLTVKRDILCREDIKKAIEAELSGKLKLKKPVQAFTDTFVRKHGFKTITKNGSKQFKDAIEWRFDGLNRVMLERSSAKTRKSRNTRPYWASPLPLPSIFTYTVYHCPLYLHSLYTISYHKYTKQRLTYSPTHVIPDTDYHIMELLSSVRVIVST